MVAMLLARDLKSSAYGSHQELQNATNQTFLALLVKKIDLF